MASINGITTWIISGRAENQRPHLQPFERPGVNGEALRHIGDRSGESIIRTWNYYSNVTNLANAMKAFEALQGQIVTYIDELGIEYRVVVKYVKILSCPETVLTVVPEDSYGDSAQELEIEWTLKVREQVS